MTTDELLIAQIRTGNDTAWHDFIALYEGRLFGYIDQRIRDRATSEDLVQETLIGFLTSLPNFDATRSIEGYLFSIASHKLTDYFRRCGRRPVLTGTDQESSTGQSRWPSHERGASTLMRSAERQQHEVAALTTALATMLQKWRQQQEWDKIRAAEMLFVLGQANKHVAQILNWSEQTVANFKFDLLERLQKHLRSQNLNPELFPELA